MKPIHLHSTVSVVKGQVSSQIGAETVVLDLHGGGYHSLVGTAPRIWTLIQQPARVADVLNTLVAEYEVPADECQGDLLALLGDLQQQKLIDIQ